MGRSDEELVEACQAGESSAFDLLVTRWEDKIRGASYRLLGSEEEARDAAEKELQSRSSDLDVESDYVVVEGGDPATEILSGARAKVWPPPGPLWELTSSDFTRDCSTLER